MTDITNFIHKFMLRYSIPRINLADIIQILILAFVIYEVILFLNKTQAWTLLKGVIILLVLTIIIKLLQFNVLFWIISKSINIILIIVVVVFHPEIRSALDRIGRRGIAKVVFSNIENLSDTLSKESVEEIVKACKILSDTKTGVLMVIENEVPLNEIAKTGIKLDATISAALIINTFEHNTPLHDGAMVIRGNRIVAATCYLPLSKSTSISKMLGTRHRAGLGISETTDSFCIIVSEETGNITIANKGNLTKVNPSTLKEQLLEFVDNGEEENKEKYKFLKGIFKNDKSN